MRLRGFGRAGCWSPPSLGRRSRRVERAAAAVSVLRVRPPPGALTLNPPMGSGGLQGEMFGKCLFTWDNSQKNRRLRPWMRRHFL